MRKSKSLYFLFLACLFCACSATKNHSSTFTTASKINGTYEANNIGNVGRVYNYNFVNLLNRKLLKDTLYFKPTEKYRFKVAVIDHKSLQMTVIDEHNTITATNIYKFKMQRDTSVLLKNKNTKTIIIPYLAGALDILKLRLKTDSANNLAVKIYNHRSGGAFLIPMGWSTTEMNAGYKRVDD